jgi:hypothetical protein
VDLGAGAIKHELRGRVAGGQMRGVAALAGTRGHGRYEWHAEQAVAER